VCGPTPRINPQKKTPREHVKNFNLVIGFLSINQSLERMEAIFA
jgi:hypothetical protein